MALLGPCDIATSSVSVRTTNGRAQALETAVNRYVALYLVTLIVIVPIDFLFLGIVAKGFSPRRSATRRAVPACFVMRGNVTGARECAPDDRLRVPTSERRWAWRERAFAHPTKLGRHHFGCGTIRI
jgi:hypothetical protein